MYLVVIGVKSALILLITAPDMDWIPFL